MANGIYRAGTATFTNGSDQVVGVGTAFLANVKPGDLIQPDTSNRHGYVKSIESDTALTLEYAWNTTTVTGGAFTVDQRSWQWNPAIEFLDEFAAASAAIGANAAHYGDTANPHVVTQIQALTAMALTPANNKGVRLTGATTAELFDFTTFAKALLASSGDMPWAARTPVASATIAADLPNAASDYINVTGSVAITSLGTMAAGRRKLLRTNAAPPFVHDAAALILPGGANIQAAAGDHYLFASLGAGNWELALALPASGKAVTPPARGDITGLSANVATLLAAADFAAIVGPAPGLLLGLKAGSWTPTFTLQTPGTFAASYAGGIQDGDYIRIGDFVWWSMNLKFNAPAFSGETNYGRAIIGGLPYNNAGGPRGGHISRMDKLKWNFDNVAQLGIEVDNAAKTMRLIGLATSASGVAVTMPVRSNAQRSLIPQAGKNGIIIRASGSYVTTDAF